MKKKKQWHKATMFEAITHASNHTPESKTKRPEGLDFDFDEVSFTDGTAIACRSEIYFSFNESSDHTVSSPIWMIYK